MYGGLQNIFHFIHGTPYISLPQDTWQLHDFAKPEKTSRIVPNDSLMTCLNPIFYTFTK